MSDAAPIKAPGGPPTMPRHEQWARWALRRLSLAPDSRNLSLLRAAFRVAMSEARGDALREIDLDALDSLVADLHDLAETQEVEQ